MDIWWKHDGNDYPADDFPAWLPDCFNEFIDIDEVGDCNRVRGADICWYLIFLWHGFLLDCFWNDLSVQFAKNVEDCTGMNREDGELLKWLIGELTNKWKRTSLKEESETLFNCFVNGFVGRQRGISTRMKQRKCSVP